MANITQNRISIVMSPEHEAAFNAAAAQMNTILDFYTKALTADERKKLRSIDVENNAFANDALRQGRSLINGFPPPMQGTISEFEKDTTLFNQLDNIIKTKLMPIVQRLNDTKRLLAHERMVSAEAVYKFLGTMASIGIEGFQSAYDVLKKRFKKQGNRIIKTNN